MKTILIKFSLMLILSWGTIPLYAEAPKIAVAYVSVDLIKKEANIVPLSVYDYLQPEEKEGPRSFWDKTTHRTTLLQFLINKKRN